MARLSRTYRKRSERLEFKHADRARVPELRPQIRPDLVRPSALRAAGPVSEGRNPALAGEVLRLQSLVGNRAVTALISRAELQRDKAPAKEPPKQDKDEQAGVTYTVTLSEIGSFEVESFSWGVSNSGQGMGQGTGNGKEPPREMYFTKKTDKYSPGLAQRTASGRHIAKVEITVKKGGKTHYTITLKDVMVSSYQSGASAGGDPAGGIDQFSLQGASVEFEYAKDGEESGGGGKGGGGDSGGSAYPG